MTESIHTSQSMILKESPWAAGGCVSPQPRLRWLQAYRLIWSCDLWAKSKLVDHGVFDFWETTFITPTWKTNRHVWTDLDLILKQADFNQERATCSGQQTPLDGAIYTRGFTNHIV